MSTITFETMPVEIIAMIFSYCLPTDMYIAPCPCEAPLLLTQVCAEWRRLAIAMPLLWSSLSVIVYPTHSDPALPLIYLWLDRSGSCPLSLSFTHEDQDKWENDGSELAAHILTLFFDFWTRWQNFSMVLPDPCPGYAITTLPESGPPLLQNLRMLIGDGLCAEEIDVAATLYASAPRLTEFTWGHSYYDIDHRTVPWHQLSCLRLECDVPMGAVLNILELAPSLTAMHLDGVYRATKARNGISQSPGRRHITHPSLLALTVVSIQPRNQQTTSCLFRHLTLPSLTHLEISELPMTPPTKLSTLSYELPAFLSRSKCPLQSLRVDSINNILAVVIESLNVVTHTLVCLDIQHEREVVDIDPLLSLLSLSTKTEPFPTHRCCPRLQHLKLGHNVKARAIVIEKLLLSRWVSRVLGFPTLELNSDWPLCMSRTSVQQR
ncbi:hypothetical protein PTI98_000792 [Pleurotus ostreatus]|nr:hypothetical protein PTI98_000792 [Pleurotus ostreatus]